MSRIRKQSPNAPAERIAYRSGRRDRQRRHWRTYDDARLPALQSMEPASSLSPGPRIIERNADGDPVAREIIRNWQPCLGWQNLIRVEAA